MASRAEIEEQIAALKAVLKEKEIDPDFTPKELVRWDPSFLGTILHMKHPTPMPRAAFQDVTKCDGEYWAFMFTDRDLRDSKYQNTSSELEMEQISVLTQDGLVVNTDAKLAQPADSIPSGMAGIGRHLTYSTCNSFQEMSSVPIAAGVNEGPIPNPNHSIIIKSNTKWDSFIKTKEGQTIGSNVLVSCTNLGIHFKRVCLLPQSYTHCGRQCNCLKGTLPLCGPDDNILDHIFIASVVKLPFQTKEVIVDKYPLSKLYEEWKADKAAGRSQRGA